MTARTPPGPHSFAVITARYSRVTKRSLMRALAYRGRRTSGNVAKSGNHRENWQFETHNLDNYRISDASGGSTPSTPNENFGTPPT
jgi:hypothetical protein